MNRKLVKLNGFEYAYFVYGICIAKGPYLGVRTAMERDGLSDIDIAVEIMDKQDDDFADFGVFGSFIYSSKFENTNNTGFKSTTEV